MGRNVNFGRRLSLFSSSSDDNEDPKAPVNSPQEFVYKYIKLPEPPSTASSKSSFAGAQLRSTASSTTYKLTIPSTIPKQTLEAGMKFIINAFEKNYLNDLVDHQSEIDDLMNETRHKQISVKHDAEEEKQPITEEQMKAKKAKEREIEMNPPKRNKSELLNHQVTNKAVSELLSQNNFSGERKSDCRSVAYFMIHNHEAEIMKTNSFLHCEHDIDLPVYEIQNTGQFSQSLGDDFRFLHVISNVYSIYFKYNHKPFITNDIVIITSTKQKIWYKPSKIFDITIIQIGVIGFLFYFKHDSQESDDAYLFDFPINAKSHVGDDERTMIEKASTGIKKFFKSTTNENENKE